MMAVALIVAATPAALAQDPPESGPEPGTTPVAASSLSAVSSAVPATPVAPFVTAIGAVSLSVDAVGTLDPNGALVMVDKPAGASVREAYLVAASTGFRLYEIQDGDITIDGVPVIWDPTRTMINGIMSVNVLADVTSIVKPVVDSAAPGMVAFLVAEGDQSELIDGSILAVVFDDPNVTHPATVVLAYGAQQVTGDRIRLVRSEGVPNEEVEVRLGVGISYGFQPTGQDNWVSVNGIRLTSSAGGQDDGEGEDGALITVGGIGDLPDNPPDPFARGDQISCPRCDDELYDLQPFLASGPVTELELTTTNPSADDNFFFAALEVIGATASWTPTLGFLDRLLLQGRFPWSGWMGDPVNTFTGNWLQQETDIGFPASVFGLNWSRSYNSTETLVTELGPAWTYAHGVRIGGVGEGGVVNMVLGDGRHVDFVPNGVGGYSRPMAFYGELVADADGSFSAELFDGQTWDFDLEGRLVSMVNWDGQIVTLTHGPNGPTQVASSTGYTLTIAYDGSGLINQVASSDGRVVAYGHDATGRLTSVTDSAGGVTHYAYNAEGLLESVTDPEGVVVASSSYDSQGRVAFQQFPGGQTASFVYNRSALETTVTFQPSGEVFVHRFTADGLLLGMTDPNGNEVSLVRRADGELIGGESRLGETLDQSLIPAATFSVRRPQRVVKQPTHTMRTIA